ncbi:alpha/beta fold hydrolase [Actinocrispum wychmicini]|uniref:Alpha/beta hydrolase family protein n=1 Tax=Actinocrispum wychmicini TaxID=1213861 RepID=A0A4R2JET5_9PSEU|nr:alpha/beta hydrolase [Actinocrispum wychmicini]TCO58211.1 alpha/beta hydrolase family protein [Actinocrispum wychmicini]
MSTYVLVPGACHGGWCFASLTTPLRRLGHDVHPITLTGLAANQSAAGVNLETHIADVLGLLSDEQIEDAVLVGHSYGGVVITGVADRAPDRVRSLVYLDAFVPADGESCWTLTNDEQRAWYTSVDETGFGTRPLPFFDPRAKPHPLATLLQPIRLTGTLDRFARRDYVYAERWAGESPFTPTLERLRDDPQWNVHTLDGGHNLMRDVPADVLKILQAATG